MIMEAGMASARFGRIIGFGLGCVASVALPASTLAVTHAAETQVEAPSNRLQVWNLNTHHMQSGEEPGQTDYRKFIAYITDPTKVAYYPDIVTIQEAGRGGVPGCADFAAELRGATSQDYACQGADTWGGSAVVYSTSRLTVGATTTVTLKEEVNGSCVFTDWKAQLIKVGDRLSGKSASVGSVHLPYQSGVPDADCAWANTKLLNGYLTGDTYGSADMKIMAGDWNRRDRPKSDDGWNCWYRGTNAALGTCGSSVGNLKWKDAVYNWCKKRDLEILKCLRGNWTHDVDREDGEVGSRIDFLFAKAYAVNNTKTVTYKAAGEYSDHRGLGSLLTYY